MSDLRPDSDAQQAADVNQQSASAEAPAASRQKPAASRQKSEANKKAPAADNKNPDQAIAQLQQQIFTLTQELNQLRRDQHGVQVENYQFKTQDSTTTLLELFGNHDKLLMIHNMGQGCRYCTLWADGFNGFLPHLESVMAVVLVSKDSPQQQRDFANSRGWRFRLASHGGGRYISEQSVAAEQHNMPGAVVYTRQGELIQRRSATVFGPGDLYCSAWGLLALAGLSSEDWTPQFNYWQRPQQLDDGGKNIIE